MDLQGILGIDTDVRNGFDGIRVHYEIDADATPDEIAGAGGAIAEALGGVRHHHQPDQRQRDREQGVTSEGRAGDATSWSSAQGTPGWR